MTYYGVRLLEDTDLELNYGRRCDDDDDVVVVDVDVVVVAMMMRKFWSVLLSTAVTNEWMLSHTLNVVRVYVSVCLSVCLSVCVSCSVMTRKVWTCGP